MIEHPFITLQVLSPGSDKSQSTVLSQQSTHSSLSQVTPAPGFVSPVAGKVGPPGVAHTPSAPPTPASTHVGPIGGIATAGTEDIRPGDGMAMNKLRRRSSSTSIDSQLTKVRYTYCLNVILLLLNIMGEFRKLV